MKMIDEITPKVDAEVRLDEDNKILWIKTDAWDKVNRVICEDGKHHCYVFCLEEFEE